MYTILFPISIITNLFLFRGHVLFLVDKLEKSYLFLDNLNMLKYLDSIQMEGANKHVLFSYYLFSIYE